MSRATQAQYVPVRMTAGARDIIDFVDSPALTALDSVVGGPPAYLESHGIRYVPEAAPAELRCAEEPPAIVPLATAEAAPRATQQELEARVDARVRKYMQDTGALPMAARAETAADRLRRLRECVEDMAEEHERALRAAPAPAAEPRAALRAAPPAAEGPRTRARSARTLLYDF